MYKINYGHKIVMKCLEVRWNIKPYIYMQKVLEYSKNIQRLYQLTAKSAKVKKVKSSHKRVNLN